MNEIEPTEIAMRTAPGKPAHIAFRLGRDAPPLGANFVNKPKIRFQKSARGVRICEGKASGLIAAHATSTV